MAAVPIHNPSRQRGFQILGWILAIGLSFVLNLFLFGIMPGLVRSVPDRPDDMEDIRVVQVVRIKRPETLPKKQERPKPPEPEKKPEQIRKLARMKASVPARVKPQLPFELNPRLPEFPNSLAMPPLENFSMNAQAPKGLYLAGDLDAPLTALATVPPVYPLRATRLGIQGWVKVTFTVAESGLVENVKIIQADPEGIFERAVVNCVSRWRFKPGTVEGVPVAAKAQTTIRFELEK